MHPRIVQHLDPDAGPPESPNAAPGHDGMRIERPDQDASEAGLQNRPRAGWRLAEMIARLQRDGHRRASQRRATPLCIPQRFNLRMRPAESPVMPPRDHTALPD